jgi:hypothetical protein
MMPKSCAILFFSLCYWCALAAQHPEKALERLSDSYSIEKVYLHFDRSDYLAGQTAWFKGYIYADFEPDQKASALYVELSNSASRVVSRQVFPVLAGFARGQIELADSLRQGQYILRAYTINMLNQGAEYLYTRPIYIFSKNKPTESFTKQKSVRIEFFPEGGNFVAGLSNSMAFKITDENGLPVAAIGLIKNDRGEIVTEFSTYHDGMGYFDITPQANVRYYGVVPDVDSAQKFPLPQQSTKGIVFRVISTGRTKQFEILQQPGDVLFRAAYMIGQMQHHVVFKSELKGDKDEMTGMINTDKLSSGILHITVFNKDGLPLAERLTFVDNKEYILPSKFAVDTLNFSGRSKNHFTLSLPDTVIGSFSVSISDPAFEPVRRSENIYSSLLLTGDLKGYVHDPAYYFTGDSDSVQIGLDLLMMTNGWRRFKWSEILKDSLPVNKFIDPGYINIGGTILLQGTRKPFADKDLLAFIMTTDSSRNIQLVHTDMQGHFRLKPMLFFDRARILFSDIKGKRNKYITVKLDSDTLTRSFDLPLVMRQYPLRNTPGVQQKKMEDEYNAIARAEGLMLEGVTVKGRKKTKLEETEEKYVTGLFGGDANRTLDLTEDDLGAYRNIFDYLQLRVPGLQIITDPEDAGSYIIRYRQQTMASSMGEMAMAIFLNEVPSDAEAISSIPAHEIALVKIFSSFAGASGNAPGGVLAIYTKKDADLKSFPAPVDIINYKGYSITKEFYSPDYTVSILADKRPDNRMTLYWNPGVVVAGSNAKVPITFFNNDRTREFKVVIEGMTVEGKMLMIEQIIKPKR